MSIPFKLSTAMTRAESKSSSFNSLLSISRSIYDLFPFVTGFVSGIHLRLWN